MMALPKSVSINVQNFKLDIQHIRGLRPKIFFTLMIHLIIVITTTKLVPMEHKEGIVIEIQKVPMVVI